MNSVSLPRNDLTRRVWLRCVSPGLSPWGPQPAAEKLQPLQWNSTPDPLSHSSHFPQGSHFLPRFLFTSDGILSPDALRSARQAPPLSPFRPCLPRSLLQDPGERSIASSKAASGASEPPPDRGSVRQDGAVVKRWVRAPRGRHPH